VCLDSDMYRVWAATGIAPQREELIGWAVSANIEAPEAILEALEDAGLVIEEDSVTEESFDELALQFIGEAFGNGLERGTKFSVVGRRDQHIVVDAHVFIILMCSDGSRALSAVCNDVDEAPTIKLDERSISALLRSLPLLVRHGIVRLGKVTQ
jgi:hypothetical protein